MRRMWASVLGLAFVPLALLSAAGASDLSGESFEQDPRTPSKPALPPFAERMDGHLAAIATAEPGRRARVARREELEFDRGRVTIEVQTESRATESVAAAIKALGGSVAAAAPGVIEADTPAAALPDLARQPGIRFLRAPSPSEPDAVVGQGVASTGADALHAGGVTGQGTKVAVVDGGFAGYGESQASGDLPANVKTVNHCANFTGIRHGTGVAEVVHDMAPGAELYLICTDSVADLFLAEQLAAAEGVKVINHSVSHFNNVRGDGSGGPGTVDAVVEQARADGILWVNSAGNYATRHWGGTFFGNGDLSHDWVAGDEGNTVAIGNNELFCAFLRWDAWPATNIDLDLALRRSSDSVEVDVSNDPQTGVQPPVESLCYRNTGAAQNFFVVVRLFAASIGTPGTRKLDLFTNDADAAIERYVTPGSVTDPGSNPEVLAAAAVCPATDGLQSYSSQGPSIDGRVKPDMSGPAPVGSYAYGPVSASGCGAGFGGTSGAAPHVAAGGALWQQPSGGPATVQALMESNARDLGVPGKDNQFGSGMLAFVHGQPDLIIRGKGKPKGAGAYTAATSARRKLRRGGKARFRVTIENDGQMTSSFALKGGRAGGGTKITYRVAGKKVTRKVRRGSFNQILAPGEAARIVVIVRAKQSAGGKRRFRLTATNVADAKKADAVVGKMKISG